MQPSSENCAKVEDALKEESRRIQNLGNKKMVKLERKYKNIIPNFHRADVQLLEILEDSGEKSVVKNLQITKFEKRMMLLVLKLN